MTGQSKLAAWRRFYNISQEEMARLIGITLRSYINKENGATQFKMDEMFLISNKIGKPIEEIFLPTNFMSHEIKGEGNATTESKSFNTNS
ncbi:DNA-binding XRE family transcriptional regulator [Salirhabdus euzebyi]|uniref:DNA-binding XRE family transcriptional regulator n=1 Tax=Salirhabdus euzebyi TaxID=394506 RepID=A0A841PT65_9BACI|nr:helix-turn-helix transcriptional regulator [Salirhabdus euzebyi]MBB6452019.1 DNA-binding XRE family transcriptional regulator [Salirhabdus euzebyi]